MRIDKTKIVEAFHAGPCKSWSVEDIARDKLVRFAEAYLSMASANYRPAAPSDGFGNIQITREQLDDENRLYKESVEYAVRFCNEEDSRDFWIGCSNYSTNRAFVFCIEAARLLAGGSEGDNIAANILGLAIKEIRGDT